MQENDHIWNAILAEAKDEAQREPILASFLHVTVLRHKTLEDVLNFHLSSKLGSLTMDERSMMELIAEALTDDPQIGRAARADLQAIRDRDPACPGNSAALLYFKGFRRCSLTELPIGYGNKDDDLWLFTSKAASQRYLGWIFIPRHESAVGY